MSSSDYLAQYTLDKLREGQSFSFSHIVLESEIDQFAELSGDINPLHLDPQFAHARGFEDRVVHGALVVAFISRMVGVYCPGRNALLQSLNMKFLSPIYPKEHIQIDATIDQISIATQTLLLRVLITNKQTSQIRVRGTVMVGFSKENMA